MYACYLHQWSSHTDMCPACQQPKPLVAEALGERPVEHESFIVEWVDYATRLEAELARVKGENAELRARRDKDIDLIAAYDQTVCEKVREVKRLEGQLRLKQDDWIEACQEIDRLESALHAGR